MKSWTGIGLTSAYVALNSWFLTQADFNPLPVPDISVTSIARPLVPLWGLLLLTPTFLVTIRLGDIYYRATDASRKEKWQERLPRAFGSNIRPLSEFGKLYQRFFLTLILLVPVAAQLHLTREFFQRNVVIEVESGGTKSAVEVVKGTPNAHLTGLGFCHNEGVLRCLWGTLIQNDYLYGEGNYRDGERTADWQRNTYFPILEPWFIVLLETFTSAYLLWYLRKLFKSPLAPLTLLAIVVTTIAVSY